MIHSQYLVYEACKDGRLNGSLSLVCKTPQGSFAHAWGGDEDGERWGDEEGEVSNKGMGSRQVQHENENSVWLWKDGDFLEQKVQLCYLIPPRPLAKGSSRADLLEHRGDVPQRPWELPHKSELPFWVLVVRPWAPGSLLSSFWETRFLRVGDRSLSLDMQGTGSAVAG